MPINKTRATTAGGALVPVGGTQEDFYLEIPGAGRMLFYILPEISESKGANYNDEPVIGRSFPVKTYSHSDNRSIGVKMHFVIWRDGGAGVPGSAAYNLFWLRAVQSCVYPEDSVNAPYEPPPVCKLCAGKLLGGAQFFGGGDPVCVIMKSYQVSYPTDCAWDETTKIPYKFDIDTNWDVVYKTSDLPGRERILYLGA